MNPFDIAKNINSKGELLDAEVVRDSAFMLNAIFSNIRETVAVANEANSFSHHMPKEAAYRFYYHLLLKAPKRYGKWHKKQEVNESDISLIMEVYGYSRQKALDVYAILERDIESFRDTCTKGGK